MATGPNTIMDIDKDKAIAIISDIIHDHIKGKHKDKISKDLAARRRISMSYYSNY